MAQPLPPKISPQFSIPLPRFSSAPSCMPSPPLDSPSSPQALSESASSSSQELSSRPRDSPELILLSMPLDKLYEDPDNDTIELTRRALELLREAKEKSKTDFEQEARKIAEFAMRLFADAEQSRREGKEAIFLLLREAFTYKENWDLERLEIACDPSLRERVVEQIKTTRAVEVARTAFLSKDAGLITACASDLLEECQKRNGEGKELALLFLAKVLTGNMTEELESSLCAVLRKSEFSRSLVIARIKKYLLALVDCKELGVLSRESKGWQQKLFKVVHSALLTPLLVKLDACVLTLKKEWERGISNEKAAKWAKAGATRCINAITKELHLVPQTLLDLYIFYHENMKRRLASAHINPGMADMYLAQLIFLGVINPRIVSKAPELGKIAKFIQASIRENLAGSEKETVAHLDKAEKVPEAKVFVTALIRVMKIVKTKATP